MKVLIADDDPQLVRALRITLNAQGYEVVAARDGADAIDLLERENPDLVILDMGMPRLDGIGFLRAVRTYSAVPIIVVSGRTGSADKIEALDAGADDYLTKPFVINELLARLRVMTRRLTGSASPVVTFGNVTVDTASHTVMKAGTLVHLTPTELRLVEYFVAHPNALVPRHALLSAVWPDPDSLDSGILRLYMSQLRKKLEDDPARPQHFITEQGSGYRLVLDPAASAPR